MNIFKKMYGVVDNYLQLGVGSTAHGIADNVNGIEAKENGNGARANTAGTTVGFPNSSKLYAFQIYMNGGTTPELVACKNAVVIQS